MDDEFDLPEDWPAAHPVIWRRLSEHGVELTRQKRESEARVQERLMAFSELSTHVDNRFDELGTEYRKLLDEYKNALTVSSLERAGVRDALDRVQNHQLNASHLMALQLMLSFILTGIVGYLAWVAP